MVTTEPAVVAAPVGGQEGDHCADFIGSAGAAERQRLEKRAAVIGVAGAVLGFLLHQIDQSLGFDWTGIQRNHPDTVAHVDAAQGLTERCQRGVASNATDIFRIMGLCRVAVTLMMTPEPFCLMSA